MSFIVVDNIVKSYLESNGNRVVVFDGFSVSMDRGKFVSIIGESGSGKTTLLNIIGAIDGVDSGSVIVDGIDITKLDEDELAEFRNKKVGYVFQNHFLLKGFSVIENVVIPSMVMGKLDKENIFRKAKELLDFLGIVDKVNRGIDEISGGERQRVSIARALINDPEFVIADEPTGNLDPKNSEIVFSLFYKLVKELGKTCIMATHNLSLAERTDSIIRLS
ncbi:MAG: ABC transporter ATP-binding protein [Spirochaetia bacterium]|nr:ABC transporter ATP-binding protein [Spirochaetota bacterium]MCX8096541.1 ABC transporter ATP-binding protein [Spirochaetota bacterium]MDW8112699.1 ABC transporter ATP-binding protein [Spirochaetia bacterium]